MADTTPVYGFPYQELGDPPDGADLGEGLATAVEAKFVTVDAAIAGLAKLSSISYAGTTDANGFLTVPHGASGTPVGGWAVNTSPTSGAGAFAHPYAIDNIGASTVRLRFGSITANSAPSGVAVQGRLFVVRP